MVAVPDATPVTTPLVLTLATAASLELHTPPTVELANVVLDPTHTFDAPVIPATIGSGLTVTASTADVVEHPLAFVIVTL